MWRLGPNPCPVSLSFPATTTIWGRGVMVFERRCKRKGSGVNASEPPWTHLEHLVEVLGIEPSLLMISASLLLNIVLHQPDISTNAEPPPTIVLHPTIAVTHRDCLLPYPLAFNNVP